MILRWLLILRRSLIRCFCFLLLSQTGHTVDGGKPLQVDQLLELAHKQYALDAIQQEQIKSIDAKYNDLTRLDNPQIQYGQGRARSSGQQGNYIQYTLSQNLQLNGEKNSLSRQKNINLKIANLEAKHSEITLNAQVLSATYEYLNNLEHAEHIHVRARRLKLIKQYLKSRQFVSPKSQLEINMIENKVDQIVIEQIDAEKLLDSSKEQLQLLLGLNGPLNVKLPWVKPERLQRYLYNIKALSELVKKRQSHQINLQQEFQDVADKSWRPDLQVFYTKTIEHNPGGNIDDAVGVNLKIPVFNTGSDRRRAAKANKNLTQLKLSREQLALSQQLKQIKQDFLKSRSVLQTLNEKTIAKKEKALKAAITNFKKGLVNASSFLDFEDQVHMYHKKVLEERLMLHKNYLLAVALVGESVNFVEVFQ